MKAKLAAFSRWTLCLGSIFAAGGAHAGLSYSESSSFCIATLKADFTGGQIACGGGSVYNITSSGDALIAQYTATVNDLVRAGFKVQQDCGGRGDGGKYAFTCVLTR